MESSFEFRQKITSDNAWIRDVAVKLWGSIDIISKEHTYNILRLPNFVGVHDGKPVGFIMFAKEGSVCEIVALYAAHEKQGLGTALIEHVKVAAKKDGCSRLWLMTTNDNTMALRFYQKRGFVITAVRTGAIDEQRKIKPIPRFGNDGIPIRDEIELEFLLQK